MIGILSYKAWHIEPAFAARMAPIVLRAIEHGTFDAFITKNREANDKAISSLYSGIDAEMVYNSRDNLPPYYIAKAKGGEKVAIIPLMGPITKNGDACSYGMRDFQNVMTRLSTNPDVTAILFHFNNAPGGSHDGTPEISHNIFNFNKATLGFGDGMIASAHYYMASQTDHIMLNSLTDTEVGSIGSLIISENVQNMIEAGNYPKTEIIRAPQSKNKALFNYIEPLTDEMRKELDQDLRDGVDGFISTVKKGRQALSAVPNDHEMFTGKMYNTKDAIKNGLADSKGTLQDAINMVAKIAKTGKSKSSTSSLAKAQVINSIMFKSKLISATFGQSEKAEPQTAEELQASLVAADTQAAVIETENAALKGTNETQTARVTELEASVTALTTQVSTLTAENTTLAADKVSLTTEKATLQTKLDATPTGQSTTIISKDETEERVNADGKQSGTESKYLTSFDAEVKALRDLNAKNSTVK